MTARRAGPGRVEACVKDNGSGIAPDVLPHVFEVFTGMEEAGPTHTGSGVQPRKFGHPTITCPDIENDTLFDPRWRQVCLKHGLKAIQSRPVYVRGKPRGTFVLAFREPRAEQEWDVALMSFAADAASGSFARVSFWISASSR